MDPSDGGVGGWGSTPQTWVQVKVRGCWGEKKPKNEVKIPKSPPQNKYKTQYFTPSASKFSETGKTYINIANWGKIDVFGIKRHTVFTLTLIHKPILKSIRPKLAILSPTMLQKITKMAISQNHILPKCHSPKNLLPLNFSMNLSEAFRINVNMDFAHNNPGRFLI